MNLNFVVTPNNKPLRFVETCEDGFGYYQECEWKNIDNCILTVVSDYVVNNYPEGFNLIYTIRDTKFEIIQNKDLKIQKATLVFNTNN